MSPFLIAFLAGISLAAWVYNKAMRQTGNNTQNSLIIAAATGVIAFIVVLTVLNFIDSYLAK